MFRRAAKISALRADFERDWNRTLFKWTDEVNDLDYRPLWNEFYEFLNRSSIGGFRAACCTAKCTRN